jgi:L-threonylcarbamoyladenylate synthase
MTDCLATTKSAIARASGLLADGRLVAFPTETVYGLGADATNDMAVARIFAAKDRPVFNPLISHVASATAAFDLGVETPVATALASAFWPGPLTLVLDRRPDCPVARLTTAGLDKIAVRVPAHAAARALLTHFGKPVAAPSANPSGRISPSTAGHVMRGLAGKIDLVLDGGPCETGVESTVVDASAEQAVILRPGGITRHEVADALKAAGFDAPIARPTAATQPVQPVAPGQLASHYAPHAAVRLNATKAAADEELIGFGSVAGSGILALSLSASGDLIEAAANLFAMLHRADDTGTAKIAIAPVPDNGLGEAINDRLRRAAAPRP